MYSDEGRKEDTGFFMKKGMGFHQKTRGGMTKKKERLVKTGGTFYQNMEVQER